MERKTRKCKHINRKRKHHNTLRGGKFLGYSSYFLKRPFTTIQIAKNAISDFSAMGLGKIGKTLNRYKNSSTRQGNSHMQVGTFEPHTQHDKVDWAEIMKSPVKVFKPKSDTKTVYDLPYVRNQIGDILYNNTTTPKLHTKVSKYASNRPSRNASRNSNSNP